MSETVQIPKIPCGNYLCNNFLKGFEISNLGIHITNRICESCKSSNKSINIFRCFYCHNLVENSKKKNICCNCIDIRARIRRFKRIGIIKRNCRGCGKDITTLKFSHKYCNRECQLDYYEIRYFKPYRLAHRKIKNLTPKNCKNCYNIFTPKRMGGIQIFCTTICCKEYQYKIRLLLKRGGE